MEWLFPVVVIALLFIGYGVIPIPRESEKGDSFSVDRGGKRAFYDLASRLLPEVSRNAGSLVPQDPAADMLVILGPSRYPDRAQWRTLHDWVSHGRSLVFAANWQDPAVALESFGIEVVPRLSEESSGSSDAEGPPVDAPRPGIETELAEGDLDWRSRGEVRFTDPGASVELSMNGSPQVVWQPVGKGVIVVVASDFVFSNLSLTKADNGVLAFRILESASPLGPVYFDEAMNVAGAPRVVGVLLEPPFRLPTVQLLIVTLLFGWMASRRFGPIENRGIEERRSLVEHAEALGILHFRVGTGSRFVASYLEYFRRDLGLQYLPSEEAPAVDSGRDQAAPEVLARALRAARSPNLDRGRVAAIIRSLASLRVLKDSRKPAGASPAPESKAGAGARASVRTRTTSSGEAKPSKGA
jgi:hypothetical protein